MILFQNGKLTAQPERPMLLGGSGGAIAFTQNAPL